MPVELGPTFMSPANSLLKPSLEGVTVDETDWDACGVGENEASGRFDGSPTIL